MSWIEPSAELLHSLFAVALVFIIGPITPATGFAKGPQSRQFGPRCRAHRSAAAACATPDRRPSSLVPRLPAIDRVIPAPPRRARLPRPLDPIMPEVYASCPLFRKPEPEHEACGAHRSDRRGGHRPPGGTPRHPPPPVAAAAAAVIRPIGQCTFMALHTADGRHPRSRPPRLSALAAVVAQLILVLGVLLNPVAAASVPFENCLSDSYINNVPTPLQWVPLWVDASFDETDKHTLRVTMWGNVTGAFTNVTLPSANDPHWHDPTQTDGKILDEPEPNVPNPKLTTLHSKIDVLTYEPWSENTNFCNTSLVNASCPLAPVFVDSNSR